MHEPKTYLALGDSMSIDYYTGVEGGGAVRQFHARLPAGWRLEDRTANGATLETVPVHLRGDLITLTIGGNNLRFMLKSKRHEELADFALMHADVLARIRAKNPTSLLIVGNVYAPQFPLDPELSESLGEANAIIAKNVAAVDGQLVDIHSCFLGHEQTYLCELIEPTLAGARAIAELFWKVWDSRAGR